MPLTVEQQKYIEQYLRIRYDYFERSDVVRSSVIREIPEAYINRLRSTTSPSHLQPKPSYPLDEPSLGRGLYGYIDLPPGEEDGRGVSVAVPTLLCLTKEYKSLKWLFQNAKHYGADKTVYRCATEDEVDEAAVRKALSDGHYCVVGAVNSSTNIYAGAWLSVFDPLMRQLHPLGAKVSVQDIVGRNDQPLRDEEEAYHQYQARSVGILQNALTPLFDENWSSCRGTRRDADAQPEEPVERALSDMSFGQFLHASEDPGSVYNLKLFTSQPRPSFIHAVADDVPALAKITLRLRPSDARQYRSWALASHAGAYTLVHHDSAGMSTYVVGASGVKYWFYVQWITEPTPTSHAFRLQAASDNNIMSIEYSSQPPWVVYDEDNQEFSFVESIHEAEESRRWEKEHPKVSQVYMIPLRPGMCIVQPSNAVHAVYNATDCVASGGHFISYESLPLVEVARRADHISEKPLTNDSHASINLILQGMCLLLNDPARPRPSLPILRSLTRMMLSPLSYSIRLMNEAEDIEPLYDTITPQVNQVLKAKLVEAGSDLPLALM